jgi:hypothetical protein
MAGDSRSPPDEPRRWRDEDGIAHLDARGLGPPRPLVSILRTLEAGAEAVLVVHLDRDPVLLYPELAERGWDAEPLPAGPGEVRLRLAKAAP